MSEPLSLQPLVQAGNWGRAQRYVIQRRLERAKRRPAGSITYKLKQRRDTLAIAENMSFPMFGNNWMRASLLIAIGIAIAAAGSVSAQSRDENWARCKDIHNDPDLRIGTCTAIIRSGRETTKNLAAAFSNRGIAYYDKGQYDRAIEDFDQAIGLDPKFALAFSSRGNAYYGKGQYDRAIEDYDQAIGLDPKDAAAFNNRGTAYRGKGEYDRAIQDYDQAISLDPKYALGFNNRGIAYCYKGQYDRAIQDYDQAISLDPRSTVAFNNRGNAYHSKGQYDRAIQDYDQAISLDPKDAEAFYNRGIADYNKGQYDRAIQDFDQAISLNPKYASAFNNRGVAYRDTGQFDRAIQDFDRAISLDPQHASAFTNRGITNFEVARFVAAASDFAERLRFAPADADIVLWLHLAHARIGQTDAEEFARNAATIDLKGWPGPVVAFYLKQMTVEQLWDAVRIGDAKAQREQGCVAAFFLAEEALLRHSAAEAVPLLRQARDTCPLSFDEYSAAAAELKRLEQ